MDEEENKKQHEELIERLKAEGQLTRNTGTNSLKSVKLEFGKFDDALDALRKNLQSHSEILSEIVGIQSVLPNIETSLLETPNDNLQAIKNELINQNNKMDDVNNESKEERESLRERLGRVGEVD
jgi:DNA anti-recombination protein RmuC